VGGNVSGEVLQSMYNSSKPTCCIYHLTSVGVGWTGFKNPCFKAELWVLGLNLDVLKRLNLILSKSNKYPKNCKFTGLKI